MPAPEYNLMELGSGMLLPPGVSWLYQEVLSRPDWPARCPFWPADPIFECSRDASTLLASTFRQGLQWTHQGVSLLLPGDGLQGQAQGLSGKPLAAYRAVSWPGVRPREVPGHWGSPGPPFLRDLVESAGGRCGPAGEQALASCSGPGQSCGWRGLAAPGSQALPWNMGTPGRGPGGRAQRTPAEPLG